MKTFCQNCKIYLIFALMFTLVLSGLFLPSKAQAATNTWGEVPVRQINSSSQEAYYGKTVAQLIYDEAQSHHINPQVILAIMQKESSTIEQSSVSSTRMAWPLFYGFDETMASFGYSESASQAKADDFGGVGQQIAYATWNFRNKYDKWENGTYGDWRSAITIDGSTVNPQSIATRLLYSYTPHSWQSFLNVLSGWGVPTGTNGANLIMTDEIFTNYSSMTANQINNFLVVSGSVYANYTIPEYVTVPYPYSYTDNTPRATAITESGSVTASPGEVVPMSVTYKNTSSYTWDTHVRLATDRQENEGFLNSFKASSWIGDYRIAHLPVGLVSPNDTVKFDFNIKIPNIAPGRYRFFVRLVQEGSGWFEPDGNGGAWWYVTIPSRTPYAQAITESGPVTGSAGQVFPMSVTFRNTSSYTWGTNVKLATDRQENEAFLNSFRAWSWPGDYRIASLPVGTVAPNATVKFDFNLRIPNIAPGRYRFFVRLVQDGTGWFEPDGNGGAWWYVTIPNNNRSAVDVYQSPHVSGSAGDVVSLAVAFRNTSAFTWGTNVKLATDKQENEAFLNSFKDTSWIGNYRIAYMNESSVAPRSAATYNFNIKIPNIAPGRYRFFVRLVQEGSGWFEPDGNGGAWWYVTVR